MQGQAKANAKGCYWLGCQCQGCKCKGARCMSASRVNVNARVKLLQGVVTSTSRAGPVRRLSARAPGQPGDAPGKEVKGKADKDKGKDVQGQAKGKATARTSVKVKRQKVLGCCWPRPSGDAMLEEKKQGMAAKVCWQARAVWTSGKVCKGWARLRLVGWRYEGRKACCLAATSNPEGNVWPTMQGSR